MSLLIGLLIGWLKNKQTKQKQKQTKQNKQEQKQK